MRVVGCSGVTGGCSESSWGSEVIGGCSGVI